MDETKTTSGGWLRINWFGVPAGVLMIILPFLGTWLRLTFGEEAVVMDISPFDVGMIFLGEEMLISPLISWFLLGLKLGMVYFGMILLVGSMLYALDHNAKAVAEELVRFSARKLLWLVLSFVLGLLLIILIANFIPEIFTSMMGDTPLKLQCDLPYLIGEGKVSVGLDMIHFICPVSMELSRAFLLAALALLLGTVSHAYQKRLY